MGNPGNEVPLGDQKEKPWGFERPIARFRGLNIKELFFKKGKVSSLHYHKEKDEIFYIISGRIRITINDEEVLLKASQTIHIPPGNNHQFHPLEDTLILEVSTRMFGDIVRLADEYGRPRVE